MSHTLRYQLMRMQAELADRQKEATTGKVADRGVELGGKSARSLSMSRDIERLKGLVDSNALASNRLDATQSAMTQIGKLADDMLTSLTAAGSGVDEKDVLQEDAARVLGSVTSILNTNINGEYLFAGINTDVRPIDDFAEPGSASKTAFDAAFQAKFGFDQNDPQAANISAADMDDFLTNHLEPEFLGAGWQANWSGASDQKITSRIALNETAETSVTANEPGLRKLAMATAALSDLLSGQLGEEARAALYERATALVGQAVTDIAGAQSEAGVAQNRITAASERIDAQVDLFKGFITDLEGVDPYEASTRVNDLITQIETSYALTSRIQKLSLLNHL